MREIISGFFYLVLLLLALGLVAVVFLLAFPVSFFLIIALIALGIARRKKNKDKPWAKALAGMLAPITIALSILAVFLVVINALEPTTAQVLVTAEDRLMMQLYKALQWISPSTTVYILLLAIATWLSIKAPQWNVIGHLSKAKGLIGKSIAIVTLLASVTFFGDKMVVKPKLDAFATRLQIEYQNAKKRKEDSAQHYLAEVTVSQALSRLAPEQQQTFKTCFEAIGNLGISDTYQDYLSKNLSAPDNPPSNTLNLDSLDSSSARAALSTPQSIALPSIPQDLLPVVANEEQAATHAAALDSDSAQGLKKIASEILGAGNDRALDAASHYLDHVVTLYAGTYGAALLPFLDDFLQPYSKKVIGEYLDKVIDYAATKITWRGLPIGSPKEVAISIYTEVAGIAQANLQAASASATAISDQVKSTNDLDTLKDLSAKATAARSQAEEATQAFQGAPSAGTAVAVDTASQAATLEATRAVEHAATEAVARRATKQALTKGLTEGAAKDLTHL